MSSNAVHPYYSLHRLADLGREAERRRRPDPYPHPSGPPPTLDQLRARRPELDRIAARQGTRSLRLFGSVARGDARTDSDLDLLIVMDSGLLAQAALGAELEQLLGCRVHLVREGALTDEARARIEQEAIAL